MWDFSHMIKLTANKFVNDHILENDKDEEQVEISEEVVFLGLEYRDDDTIQNFIYSFS
jgi:hypothetical protein